MEATCTELDKIRKHATETKNTIAEEKSHRRKCKLVTGVKASGILTEWLHEKRGHLRGSHMGTAKKSRHTGKAKTTHG